MKKLFILTLCAAAVVVTGCQSKNTKKAGEKTLVFVNHLQSGDNDRFVDCMAFDKNATPEQIKQEKDMYVNALNKKVQPEIKKKGGIKQTKVVSEKTSEDGKLAKVEVEKTFNNGETQKHVYDLVWEDDDWKIDMKDHKDVWKIKTPEGFDIVKLKEYDNKHVIKHIDEDGREVEKEKIKADGKKHIDKHIEDGHREVTKIKEKKDETVVIHKEDGKREVTRTEK